MAKAKTPKKESSIDDYNKVSRMRILIEKEMELNWPNDRPAETRPVHRYVIPHNDLRQEFQVLCLKLKEIARKVVAWED